MWSSTIRGAAEYKAACTAADIGRDRLPRSDARDVKVEVRNDHHQQVLTATVSMEVDRVMPPPEPPCAR
ncbi:DUF6894 family protein [Microvirga massiliensis]|uniref:DUF6894 family protein n=1 Tax=Microvirga massiliensis TaxID=1033741 RepID=UPI0011CA3848|nr:hypothetical protein [Microvirga massiliensis]